jgi:hypothetical protein
MKLYTEEQVHIAMLWALGRHGIYIPNKHYQDLIDLLTPIELPSDEEIQNMGKDVIVYNDTKRGWFVEGLRFMRDKIQGGNK